MSFVAVKKCSLRLNPSVRIKTRHFCARSRETVLVIGGYGTFGSLLCERLATLSEDSTVTPFWILIGGRNTKQGKQMVERLKLKHQHVLTDSTTLDITDSYFVQKLKELKPKIVIHTSGLYS